MRQLLDRNEYRGDFNDLIYNEIYVNQYFSSIYDVYFDDNYIDNDRIDNDSNGNKDIINGVFIDKLEFECKENMKGA